MSCTCACPHHWHCCYVCARVMCAYPASIYIYKLILQLRPSAAPPAMTVYTENTTLTKSTKSRNSSATHCNALSRECVDIWQFVLIWLVGGWYGYLAAWNDVCEWIFCATYVNMVWFVCYIYLCMSMYHIYLYMSTHVHHIAKQPRQQKNSNSRTIPYSHVFLLAWLFGYLRWEALMHTSVPLIYAQARAHKTLNTQARDSSVPLIAWEALMHTSVPLSVCARACRVNVCGCGSVWRCQMIIRVAVCDC